MFGLLPLGTGNDFAAALGIPSDIDAALQVFQDGHTVDVDVGRLDDRVFVNISAGGFVAEVSDAVTPQLKTIAGRLAYLIGGAQTLLSFEPVRARSSRLARRSCGTRVRSLSRNALRSRRASWCTTSTFTCSRSATRG